MSYNKLKSEFLPIDIRTMRPDDFIDSMNKVKLNWIELARSKSGFKEQKYCPICESDERQIGIDVNNEIKIYECKSCSLAYVDPFPINSSDIYEKKYFKKSLVSYDKLREYRINRFGLERLKLIKKYITSGSVLDIGCGVGWFLEAAKKDGFKVYGQEISSDLADFTRELLNVKVFESEISEINLKFDVITMFDLIEHVSNPLKLVIDCKQLLNPGGIILAFTPNYDSLGIAEMGKDSSLICPPAHLTYFTKKSVTELAKKLDMNLLHYQTKGMDIADIAAYNNFLGEKKISENLFELFEKIQPIIDKSESANHMRFILGK
jgi:2-polyprenyl-3-methyl-5-hydroxy-6-metoxy-1,4-benzoquinol methylase